MIQDKILIFGEDDSIAAVASSSVVADYYADLGTKKSYLYRLSKSSTSHNSMSLDYGEGGDLWYHALVTTALKASSSATFTVKLMTYSTASIDSGTTLLTHTTGKLSSTSATSSADAGDYLIRAKVPTGVKRYIGTVYVASADKMSAGKVSSWISLGTATDV